MDSEKVKLDVSRIAGAGVFAIHEIAAGEVIATFDGPFFDLDYQGWNPDLQDHAIQCAPRRFRDSTGIARFVNHSCEPNCGIRGLFDIVAMKTITPGEEITWDYEMTEDSEWWRMECRCGANSCRKIIGAYRHLPADLRAKYKGFVSDWLVSSERVSRTHDVAARCNHWQLLNTVQSLPIGHELHAFEAGSLQTDFRRGCGDFAHWFKSGRLFYASICEPSATPSPCIRAVVSVFVADSASCARFIRGEIAEHQLEAWTGARNAEPVIYFSTIISPERRWISVLYQSLLSDLQGFKNAHGLSFCLGLTVASTADGVRHLSNNGFVPLHGPRYVGRYAFLAITAASAKSAFWVSILDPLPTSSNLVAAPPSVPQAHVTPDPAFGAALFNPFSGKGPL